MGDDIYRLLNEYSVLGPSSLVGIWSSSLRGDIIYLYKIINFIK